jgi:hypothetical protein
MTAFRLRGWRGGEEIREKGNTRDDRWKIGTRDQFDGKWAHHILQQL